MDVLQNEPPSRARAMLNAYFTVACIWTIVLLFLAGLFGSDAFWKTSALLPGAGLGLMLAPALSAHLDKARLRALILTVSSVSAALLILR